MILEQAGKFPIEIFCVLYYIFSITQSIPCLIKLIKTKKSGDYSLLNRLCQYLGLICWTIYLPSTLVLPGDLYLLIIGIFDVVLLTTENILILLYYKERNINENI